MTDLRIWGEWLMMATAPDSIQTVSHRVAQVASDVDENNAILRWRNER